MCEYLATAALTDAPDWLERQKQRLRHNHRAALIAELAGRREPAELPDEDAPVRLAHRYLSYRSDSLDYASAIAAGLPIGSGLIESGQRHILQRRLKLPGAAWSRPNAEAIAHACAIRANGLWDAYWSNNPAARHSSHPRFPA